jgi:hypothetical protein
MHVVDSTPLPAERVLVAARDFSERRADLWPDAHVEHLHVHERGDTSHILTNRPRGAA